MTILISPYCKNLRNGKPNPKNFPYWPELVGLIEDSGHRIIQVGSDGEKRLVSDFRTNLSFKDLKDLILQCDIFVCVDTWLQHAAHHYGKSGVVIFGQSDPRIFGYPENTNLLKSESHLRPNQFWLWEQADRSDDVFVSAKEVMAAIERHVPLLSSIQKSEA